MPSTENANKDKLIKLQQIEIEGLKCELELARKNLREINLILCCVGGGLNDNLLGYNKAQKIELAKINYLTQEALDDSDES